MQFLIYATVNASSSSNYSLFLNAGYCQLGNGTTNPGMTPALVTTNLNDKVITQVACGSHHSLALTSEGEVSLYVYCLATHEQ